MFGEPGEARDVASSDVRGKHPGMDYYWNGKEWVKTAIKPHLYWDKRTEKWIPYEFPKLEERELKTVRDERDERVLQRPTWKKVVAKEAPS